LLYKQKKIITKVTGVCFLFDVTFSSSRHVPQDSIYYLYTDKEWHEVPINNRENGYKISDFLFFKLFF